MFALVHPDGSVLETQQEKFPVHPDMQWVDIGLNPAGIKGGWRREGSAFVAPPPAPQPVPFLTVDALADLLIEKKVLTKAEVDGKKK